MADLSGLSESNADKGLNLQVNVADAVAFLRMLDPRPEARFDLCTLPEVHAKTFLGAELDGPEFASWIRKENETLNVHLTVNEARAGTPRDIRLKAEHIGRHRAFFVDVDFHKNEPGDAQRRSDLLADWASSELPPTRVLDSGYGVWPFWVPAEPVTVESIDGKAQVCALVERYGGDKSCTDLSRLTRLAGTINHKFGQKRLARLLPGEGPHTTPAELAAWCPPVEQAPERATSAPADVEALAGFEHRSRRATHFLLHEAPASVEFSEYGGDNALFETVCGLKERAIPKAIAFELLRDVYNPFRCEPPWSDSEMRNKVNRVWNDPKKVWGAKVQVDPELEYADESANLPDSGATPSRLEDDIYESESVATFNWSRDQDYLVKYLVNRGQVGAITAPPESGKSPVLMDLCAHVSLGKPFNGLRVREPSFCYYYATEGKSDIGNRFKGARTAHGFENDPDCPFEFRCGGLILGAADPQKSQKATDKLIRTVKKRAAHYGRKPGLIIVDTGSQAIVGTDSDDAVVRNLIQNCKRIASETGATVIIAAHPPKSGDSLIRGSGAYVADAEFVWSIEVDAKTGRRELVNARSKAFVKGKRFRFSIPVIDLGADSEGDHVTAPGIEWVDTPEVEMEVLPEKNEELALRVLNDLVDEKIAAGKIGAFRFKEGHEAFTNAKNAKNTDPEIGTKSCTNTRSAFNSALTRLVRLGAFEKVGENKQSQYVRPR